MQNTRKPGKLQYKCYIRWVLGNKLVMDQYTDRSVLFINGYLMSSDTVTSGHRIWTENLKAKTASQIWNSQIKVVKLLELGA